MNQARSNSPLVVTVLAACMAVTVTFWAFRAKEGRAGSSELAARPSMAHAGASVTAAAASTLLRVLTPPSLDAAPASSAAPAAEPPTPSAELDSYLVPLVASGRESTLDKAVAAQVAKLTKIAQEAGARVEAAECYAGGCSLTMVALSASTAVEVGDRYTASEEFGSWVGAKFQSGVVERGPQRQEMTWILYAQGVAPDPEPSP